MPESLEDLWVLSQFISPNDKILATTQRKVKIGNDSTKQITKLIFIELEVIKTSFESDILRVSGTIQNETEFTAVGQSHSLNFNVNDKIKIQKANLLNFEQKLLDRAVKTKKSMSLLILLDKSELIASQFGDFSYQVFFEKKGLGSKKQYHEEINENEEKLKLIEDLLKKDYSHIIFAGPGSWKDSLKKYIEDKTGLKTLSLSFPEISAQGVQKAIKQIHESGILKESSLGDESTAVSNLLENINKNKKHIYGYKNTQTATNEGKVELLLISTKFIDKQKEDEKYTEINELMKTVEQLNGNLIIVNSKNEPGKILDGLGGIAGICRY